MKTTQQVINESGIPAKLIRSTIRQLGDKSQLSDVCNHGADCGFTGFTYYSDTVSFYNRNKKEIIELLNNQMDLIGDASIIEMVKSFNCLKNVSTKDEIAQTLYGTKNKYDNIVANALAWYALEEVARVFCDY